MHNLVESDDCLVELKVLLIERIPRLRALYHCIGQVLDVMEIPQQIVEELGCEETIEEFARIIMFFEALKGEAMRDSLRLSHELQAMDESLGRRVP